MCTILPAIIFLTFLSIQIFTITEVSVTNLKSEQFMIWWIGSGKINYFWGTHKN